MLTIQYTCLALQLLCLLVSVQSMFMSMYYSKLIDASAAKICNDAAAEQTALNRAQRALFWAWPARVLIPAVRAEVTRLATRFADSLAAERGRAGGG